MGMPATVELSGEDARRHIDQIFNLWEEIDARFSTYKENSEIMRINRGEIAKSAYSAPMREIFELSVRTANDTGGYFDIRNPRGVLDPSGVVKGWAIQKAAEYAMEAGFTSFYIEIGGDIQTRGTNAEGAEWTVGIRNPFKHDEIVKVVTPRGKGIATSGTSARGAHIYNPHAPKETITDIVSISVLGPDIAEADRFATAAFAMGRRGIAFIEGLNGFEGYQIDRHGIAIMTSGFEAYTV